MDGLAVVAEDTLGATNYNPLALGDSRIVFAVEAVPGKVISGRCRADHDGGADALWRRCRSADRERTDRWTAGVGLGDVSPGKHVGQLAKMYERATWCKGRPRAAAAGYWDVVVTGFSRVRHPSAAGADSDYGQRTIAYGHGRRDIGSRTPMGRCLPRWWNAMGVKPSAADRAG